MGVLNLFKPLKLLKPSAAAAKIATVSYTHLTLPTILRV